MTETTETRELLKLNRFGAAMRGTYHKPGGGKYLGREGNAPARIGMLFLSGLPSTRAGQGDAAVYFADSLAQKGYPSFRIDLPGFGDSEGDPPEDCLRLVNQGEYAATVSNNIEELAARFSLSGIVLIGHCAGAVSAIYTAAVNKSCKGLVLIDPYFYAAQIERKEVRQQLTRWAEHSRTGRVLGNAYGRAKKILLSLCSNIYPDHANVPLLRCWKQVASSGMPILILNSFRANSPGKQAVAAEFDFLQYVVGLAGRRSKITVETIEGANHTFSNRVGRTAVPQHTGQWLQINFPLLRSDESAKRAAYGSNTRKHQYLERL